MNELPDHEPLRARLRAALPTAMKARDTVAVTALRGAIAAIDNAEAVDLAGAQPEAVEHARLAGTAGGLGAGEVARAGLSEAQAREVIEREAAERRAAAADYERLGHADQAAALHAEADVLAAFLAQPA